VCEREREEEEECEREQEIERERESGQPENVPRNCIGGNKC
jgi:hypothetical protein